MKYPTGEPVNVGDVCVFVDQGEDEHGMAVVVNSILSADALPVTICGPFGEDPYFFAHVTPASLRFIRAGGGTHA